MSSTQLKQKKEDEGNYLEKKFGKEPKISKDELEKMRWTWH